MADLNGQWIGEVSGDGTGRIIVNVDKRGSVYEGLAYLHDNDVSMPSTIALVHTNDLSSDFKFRAPVHPIHPDSEELVDWNSIKVRFPDVTGFSTYADVTGSVRDKDLRLSWVTDLGINGHAVLPRSQADQPSEIIGQEMSWEQFKTYVGTLQHRRQFLFRGQNNSLWRLRTSFHRRGRANLPRFVFEDVPMLHRHLRTKHLFNLTIPAENGAFFNLVRHHGYPTPLLDWSSSPYVAAFFAYRHLPNKECDSSAPDSKVRIHVFNRTQWERDQGQPLQLNSARLFLSVGDFLAIENERMIPQQAASIVSNVDDVESFLKEAEIRNGVPYLTAIDLPKRERRRVINELSYMGITAGPLFPGLDGVCEEFTERNFESDD